MKRTLYLLLLIFLLSCGQSPDPHRVFVHTSYIGEKEVSLRSIRSRSIVVQDITYQEKSDPNDGLYVISLDTISYIRIEKTPSALGTIVGCGFGAILGILVGFAINPNYTYGDPATVSMIGCIVGASVGAVSGALIGGIDDNLYPSNIEDIEYLRFISSYPDEEPDELKKIK